MLMVASVKTLSLMWGVEVAAFMVDHMPRALCVAVPHGNDGHALQSILPALVL